MQITTEDKKETYEEKSSIGQTIQQSVFEKGAKTFNETAHGP